MSSIWYLSHNPSDGAFSTPSNGSFLEFNRDLFLCNQISSFNQDNPQSADSTLCKDYPTTEYTCPTVDKSDLLTIKNCEICKNFKYKDWYDSNVSSNKAFSDTREEYLRSWLQSWNLGIGILFVLYGIYYQQS